MSSSVDSLIGIHVGQIADRLDPSAGNPDVGGVARGAGAVNDQAFFYYDVERQNIPLSSLF